MTRRRSRRIPGLFSPALPMMMARLTLASAEVIARRGMMMMQGRCSPAEYQRMVREKMEAAQDSAGRATRGRGLTAMLAPWEARASRNAKRLRGK